MWNGTEPLRVGRPALWPVMHWAWATLLVLLTGAMAPAAHAQLVDELSLQADGTDWVLTLRLAAPVQLRRSVQTAGGQMVLLTVDLLPGHARPQPVDGLRQRVGDGDRQPQISVSEEEAAHASRSEHKLVLRLDRPARSQSLSGTNPRELRLRLSDLGPPPAVASAAPAASSAAAPAPAAASAVADPNSPSDADILARANQLLATARSLLAQGNAALAVEYLNETLNLPPHARSAEAQLLMAQARQALGDWAGARHELALFLTLYPSDPQADTARLLLAGLAPTAARPDRPPPPAAPPAAAAGATQRWLQGGWSQSWLGGHAKTRTQWKDTPLDGQLPQVVSESTLSGVENKMLLSALDFSWRQRDTDRDVRLVLRDQFVVDAMPGRPERNRLSALYLDWKERGPGLSARVGRQNGQMGGTPGRFDGVQAGWAFVPKWKLLLLGGQPAEPLLDSQRSFAGVALEAEALAPQLGANLYLSEHRIDSLTDRRPAGLELRWFDPATMVFSQLEYDLVFRALNLAALQASHTRPDGSSITLLLDHRNTPPLSLGNALFFPDITQTTLPRRMDELLATHSLDSLRQRVSATTARANQAVLGWTVPVNTHWQLGADLRLTQIDPIAPVPDLLPQGLPGTGQLWGLGLRAIGSRLWGQGDSHVADLTLLRGPDYSGWMASYQLMSQPSPGWRLEPALRLYRQSGPTGLALSRNAPGLRLAWRGSPRWTLEADLSVEFSRVSGPSHNEQATRLYHCLGYRLDF